MDDKIETKTLTFLIAVGSGMTFTTVGYIIMNISIHAASRSGLIMKRPCYENEISIERYVGNNNKSNAGRTERSSDYIFVVGRNNRELCFRRYYTLVVYCRRRTGGENRVHSPVFVRSAENIRPGQLVCLFGNRARVTVFLAPRTRFSFPRDCYVFRSGARCFVQ